MKHSPLIASACLALVLMSSSLIGSSEARNKKKYVGETGGDFEFIDEVSPKWLHGSQQAIPPAPLTHCLRFTNGSDSDSPSESRMRLRLPVCHSSCLSPT